MVRLLFSRHRTDWLAKKYGLLLLAVLLSVATQCEVACAVNVSTHPVSRRQQFNAWGTSLAWFGHAVGDWVDVDNKNALADLLFDPVNGLGMNRVRYNIGGGQNPALPGTLREGGDVPGWVPTTPSNPANFNTWQWDFNADEHQRWFLQAALDRGVDHVEAFSLSPPWWMTISQDVRGAAVQGQTNLSVSRYDQFAEYITGVVQHYETNLGIHFETLSPINEPSGNWWWIGGGTGAEGMFTPSTLHPALLNAVATALVSKGLSTQLASPEEVNHSVTNSSYSSYNQATRDLIAQINAHSYGATSNAAAAGLRNLAAANNTPVAVTEFGNNSSGPLSGGIDYAEQITRDLNILQTPTWTSWQAIVDSNYHFGWGLVHASFSGAESFAIQKKYHMFRQFSSFIRPGAHILQTTESNTVATYDEQTDTITLVVTNGNASDANISFEIGPGESAPTFTRKVHTTSTQNFLSLGPASLAGSTSNELFVGESVTTLVFHRRPNKISNSGYELPGGTGVHFSLDGGWESEGNAFFGPVFDNSLDGSGSAVLITKGVGNAGAISQHDIGSDTQQIAGTAYQFSIDALFQNDVAGGKEYDADTYLGLEFYAADDQTLVHGSEMDFMTLIEPNTEDNDYRVFRTEFIVAPAGSYFVRPVVRFDNVGVDSTGALYVDNAYLQIVDLLPGVFEADFDGDGDVDEDDLTQWEGDFGVNADSDADGDGDSDGADLLVWQRQLGSGVPLSSSATGVPEPATVTLLATLALVMLARRPAKE